WGYNSAFSYKAVGLSKQLKNASEQNAKYCIIFGDEFKECKIVKKDMATGQQETIPVNEFLENAKKC
ncbi:MAG TPA: His/Gly/Thr/Pro-type tRNA ligase C-terminal domain-containing protein, partial [Sedimentisphaerales bacterium]